MTVWIRIGLYALAGWLAGSGYIGEEVRSIITTDPAVATGIQTALAALVGAVALQWRRLALRWGWST
jgi:hypothetical protein